LQDWLIATDNELGYVTSAQTMYDLSRDWYAGRLDEQWSPPSAAQAGEIFTRHGLTGDFWRLGR
jgi:hypothetical protein